MKHTTPLVVSIYDWIRKSKLYLLMWFDKLYICSFIYNHVFLCISLEFKFCFLVLSCLFSYVFFYCLFCVVLSKYTLLYLGSNFTNGSLVYYGYDKIYLYSLYDKKYIRNKVKYVLIL